MLLDEQRETPFDIRFRLFGTHVRISPWFWLVAVFFEWQFVHPPFGPEYLIIAVLCVLFSLLLHEFGHIGMGRLFGSHGYIVIQGFCGLAVGAANVHSRWKRIAVTLAGPGINLLLAGMIFALKEYVLPAGLNEYLAFTLFILFQINLWWAIFNLLPVWPLDGGQITRELFTWGSRTHGVRLSLALSMVTAMLVALNSISVAIGGPRFPYVPVGDRFTIAFFLMFAVNSFLLLQVELTRIRGSWRDPDDSDRLPWETDPDDWKNR